MRRLCVFFFFNDTATTEIYTLSLHDALPIYVEEGPAEAVADGGRRPDLGHPGAGQAADEGVRAAGGDRKSTRLNSSHANISYAVFCLKKKNHPGQQPPLLRGLVVPAY